MAIVCIGIDYRYKVFGTLKNIFIVPRYYMLQTINLPFELFREITKYTVLQKNIVQENALLKRLVRVQSASLQRLNTLEAENTRLKTILQFVEKQKNTFGLANLIGVNSDPFKHQVVLNRGSQQGVYIGQPIIHADGVLGSIVNVEPKISMAMLITDISYAIPVVNLRNGFRAIALGTGKNNILTLQHVPNTADVKEQDLFVTSGIGGKYPPGYKVGIVTSVKQEVNFPFASINLKTSANIDDCQEVLLLYAEENINNK